MTIAGLTPVLCGTATFRYTLAGAGYPRLSHPKTQDTYRFLVISEGELLVDADGERERCRAGDAVYLYPGAVYRLTPCGADFSLFSLFFALLPDKKISPSHAGCRFVPEGTPSAPPPVIDGAPALSRCRVLRGGAPRHSDRLAALGHTDPLYPFHINAGLAALLSELLLCRETEGQAGGAAAILAYLRAHPEAELTAAALGERFSYHPNYVSSLVRRATGRSLAACVRAARIDAARAMLFEGGVSLTRLALSLGYYDYSHFYKAFVAETGLTPTAYLAALRG